MTSEARERRSERGRAPRRRGRDRRRRQRRRGLRLARDAAARCASTAARSRASPRRPRRGVGVRAWIGAPGRLRLRHRPLRGRASAAIAARAAEAAAVADEDEFAAPPQPAEIEALPGLERPLGRRLGDLPQVAELALAVERTALDVRPAPRRGRAGRLRRLRRAGRDRLLDRRRRRVRGLELLTPTCRRWPRARGRARPASASASPAARAASTRRRSAREGGRAGAGDDRRRQAGLALLPGRPRPDRRRQLRRPDRRRRSAPTPCSAAARRSPAGSARRSASEAFALHDDGLDPEGPASAPFDGEGVPRRRTALIEGGRAAHLPLRHLHGQPRAAPPRPATPAAAATARLPSVSPSNLVVAPGDARLRGAAGRGGGGRLRHRRRRPALRRQPGHRRLLGRRLGPGDPRRRAGRAGARVHDRQRPGRDAAAPSAPPARRPAGSPSAARSALRRC